VKRTPMLDQYLEQKQKYPDALLFFRMGDFYELFFEDAVTASRELEIVLTSREKNKDNQVPMCGVPHHAVEGYIRRLLDRGYKVAISEQMEDPSKVKGIVRRAVTRVITPGVTLTPDMVEGRESRYLVSVAAKGGAFGAAFADFTTGEFAAFEVADEQSLFDELGRIYPAEILLPENMKDALPEEIVGHRTFRPLWEYAFDKTRSLVQEHFGVASLEGLGLEGRKAATAAVGVLVNYINENQGETGAVEGDSALMAGSARYMGGSLEHLRDFRFITLTDSMIMDATACANLELVETLRERKRAGSLLGVIDRTVTSAGARLLKKWLLYPLRNVEAIKARQDAVHIFAEEGELRRKVGSLLDGVHDLQRLAAKVAGGVVGPRDMLALASTLEQLPPLKELLTDILSREINGIRERLDPLDDLVKLIRRAIRDDAPANLRDGGVFKTGFDAERDEYETLARDSRKVIAGIESRERERTGIGKLKVGYNKVFGYYIEISKANLAAVPGDYIRKQTLVGAERFVTPELKELEEKILNAESKMGEIEYRLFKEIRNEVASHLASLQKNAAALAELDVYRCMGEVAARYRYVRPEVNDEGIIDIEAGRHPVVERMSLDERFVPNDIHLDPRQEQILIITGPNMAGKSTVMRQTALITILAQMGSFVPADRAVIGVVDRIFTRVGAGDVLHRGQSTFMVEMSEAAHILRHATPASLVLLDEIGRGTSTYDGLSIAWAVAEYLHDKVGAKTLFATHYHELTDLALTKERVRNVHIAVKEWGGKVIFLRKIVKGGINRSYGIQVARLAGIPESIVSRAREILHNLESGEIEAGAPRLARPSRRPTPQMTLFDANRGADERTREVVEQIKDIDPDNITPMEALSLLAELRRKLGED